MEGVEVAIEIGCNDSAHVMLLEDVHYHSFFVQAYMPKLELHVDF